MAITNSARLGLKKYSDGADPHPSRVEFNAMIDALDSQTAVILPAAAPSARPAAGTYGRFFPEQGTGRLWFDNGTSWQEVTTTGGGGAGAAVVAGGTGSEGSSTRAARADHTHPLPLATGSAHGAMSSTDKAKLDGATADVSNGTLVQRGPGGSFQVAAPVYPSDVANKSYVDSKTWDASAITSGQVSTARLPAASSSTSGLMSAADKVKLDSATINAIANSMVMRGPTGSFQVGSPSAASDVAHKSYVDSRVSSHTHAGSDITSGIPYSVVNGSNQAWNSTYNGGGSWATVAVDSTGRFFRYTSTKRHKENIRPLGEILEDVLTLEPVRFDYRAQHGGLKDQVGLIAEDVDDVFPEVIQREDDGTISGLNHALLVPHLIGAIQELADIVSDLTHRIDALEERE